MTTRIEELMNRWSAWKMRGSGSGGGYGRCMTDIVISGMKGTLCRRCLGEKFLLLSVDGRMQYCPCPLCKGLGFIPMRNNGINPAMIPSTYTGFKDPTAEKVDGCVQKLIRLQRLVVEEQYLGGGYLKYKAIRLRMSISVFSRHLDDAMVQIECRYFDRFPKIIHEQSTSRLLEA